jgi:hypothetical protein
MLVNGPRGNATNVTDSNQDALGSERFGIMTKGGNNSLDEYERALWWNMI